MESKRFWEICSGVVGGAYLSAMLYAGSLYFLANKQPFNTIPTNTKIEAGYVKPSQLEIKLKDINGDGRNETLMEYNGKSYLLKLDKKGKPIVQAYKIQPARIKIK